MKVRQNNLLIETKQKNTKSDCITDFAPQVHTTLNVVD